ncbi:MAG: hypothetical protein WKG07_48970 [Hymenobacter sp.]
MNETGVDNGADGIDYDSQGRLYTGSFGDGTLYRVTLKPDGSYAKPGSRAGGRRQNPVHRRLRD